MLTSVEGIYKDGKIELLEEPADVREARVIVTFLPAASSPEPAPQGSIDLRARGMGEAEAANLRARLKAFAEDWEREDMRAYDAPMHDRDSERAALEEKLAQEIAA